MYLIGNDMVEKRQTEIINININIYVIRITVTIKIVIMDNVGIRKSKSIIREKG